MDPETLSEIAQQVIDTCEANFDAHSGDCSGFARAVGAEFGVRLVGLADQICDQIQSDEWTKFPNGVVAAQKAEAGFFVIAGLKGAQNVPPQSHGHVAVVVAGPLAHGKYPSAYWGKLGGVGAKNKTLNFSWNAASRDLVVYAGRELEVEP